MASSAPITEYFEVKAKNIVCKYSSESTMAATSSTSKVNFNNKMRKVEQELDVEINGILSSFSNTRGKNAETVINELFFLREKARLQFLQANLT